MAGPEFRMSRVLSLALAVLVTTACTSFPRPADEGDTEADIAAIEATIERMTAAYIARDWDAFSSHFTEDAIWMPPGRAPLQGEAEWWGFASRFWNTSRVIEMHSKTDEIIVAGDWAFERHTERTTTRREGRAEPSTRHYKGVWLFRRSEDGEWRIARYIWNKDPEAAEP